MGNRRQGVGQVFTDGGSTVGFALLAGAAFTGAISVSADVGVAHTPELTVQNPGPATVGVQKWSPVSRMRGYVWETTGPSSKSFDFDQQLETVQGTAGTAVLRMGFSLNGGALTTAFKLFSSGGVSIGSAAIDPGAGAIGIPNNTALLALLNDNITYLPLALIDSTSRAVFGSGSITSIYQTSAGGVTFICGGLNSLGLTATTLIIGADGGAGPTAFTIRGAQKTGADVAAANVTIQSAQGTGAGAQAKIVFQTGLPTGSSSTGQVMTTIMTIDGGVTLSTGLKFTQTTVQSTAYTIKSTDIEVYVDPTTPFALQLPSPSVVGAGKVFYVVSFKASLLNMTLVRFGAEKINNTAGTLTLTAVQSCRIYCNGTDWAVT